MGEFGRRRVETELAWEHSIENLLAAYDRVFTKRTRPADLTRRRHEQKADQGRQVAITGDDASAGTAQVTAGDVDQNGSPPSYVLITPARNEEAFIEKTIESMIHQTVLPMKWVIVDDGSTDGTAAIVETFAKRYPWIELVRRAPRKGRNFAAKVYAFNDGFERIRHLRFELIGNLDADVSFGPDHFEFLMGKFLEEPALGVAGTAYTQEEWDSTRNSFEGQASVHGACQVFRYQCFQDVGGYRPNLAGGIDWIAVTTARMKGWKTRNYPDRRFHHHRTMGTAERNKLGAMFDYGKKDHFLGGSPVWELFRAGYQMTNKPILIGGISMLCGYCWSALQRAERPVSRELMRFHRREQMRKLRTILGSLVRLRKVEKYLPVEW
jgi:glycosyltransferase involved in cell wall biosynthesis